MTCFQKLFLKRRTNHVKAGGFHGSHFMERGSVTRSNLVNRGAHAETDTPGISTLLRVTDPCSVKASGGYNSLVRVARFRHSCDPHLPFVLSPNLNLGNLLQP